MKTFFRKLQEEIFRYNRRKEFYTTLLRKFNQKKMKQLIQGSVKTLEEKQFGYDIIMHSNYCLLMAEILRVWKQEGFQIKKSPFPGSPSTPVLNQMPQQA